jgi:type IV pilus assembly protein PilV
MIEVLVAIVVMSIGLLGLAGLQATGIKVNQGATLRWKASQLAADLADRMRADQAGFNAAAPSTANPCVVSAGATAGTASCPVGFSATTLYDWASNQLTALPGGKAALVVTPGTGDWQVYVGWDDARAGGVSAGQCAPLANPTGCFVLATRISS